jgi:hypothetical protein
MLQRYVITGGERVWSGAWQSRELSDGHPRASGQN